MASGASKAASAAAEPPPEPPGIRSGSHGLWVGPVRGVLGRGAHRELVHVGLAEDDDVGVEQPLGDRRVVRRDPALQDLRAAGGRRARVGQHVLERQRHAGQRAERLARGDLGVDRGGLARARSPSTCRKACTSPSTAAIRSRWAWVTSTEVVSPAAIWAARSAAVLRVTSRHHASPRIRGTRNRSCSAAGAPASTSATRQRRPDHVGPEDVGQRQRVRGRRDVVGGHVGHSATDSRITSSCGARWASSSAVSSIRASRARAATSSGLKGHGSLSLLRLAVATARWHDRSSHRLRLSERGARSRS